MTLYAEILETDPTKIVLPNFEWRYQELVKALPSSSYNSKTNLWHLNLTWPTCLALQTTFAEKLSIGPNLAQWWKDEYNNRILPSYQLRHVLSVDEGYDFLYPHQRADVQFLSLARRAILANGLGSGKSRSSFATLRHMHEQGEDVFPVLITCPNSTKRGWKNEIEEVMPGLDIRVVDGNVTQRRKLLEPGADVYILNWESVRTHSRLKAYGNVALKKCVECKGKKPDVTVNTCEVHIKELNKIGFKAVIGDEIHRIKDPSAKVSRAFKAATGDADIRIALSGTPIASTPADLFSTLNWLYPEAYPSKIKFLDRFCDLSMNAYQETVVLGIKNHMKAEFFGGIDPILRRMPKEAILPFLPPVMYERRDVEMNPKQKKAYEQMKKHMIAQLDGEQVIATSSPLTQMGRMHQFASAYGEIQVKQIYNSETQEYEDKEYLVLSDPSCKVDAFMNDIEEFGSDSVVVFAQSKQLIMLLSNHLTKAGYSHGLITGDQDTYEREMHMKNFQAGKTKFVLSTIQAGGTGITLTKARVAVFLQRSWDMIGNVQAEGRNHRIGSEQHDSILIVDYVTAGSVEERVIEAVRTKTDNLQEILRDKTLMLKHLKEG